MFKIYNYILESDQEKKDKLSEFMDTLKSPQDLFKWMGIHVKFDWYNRYGNKRGRRDFGEEYLDKYRVMSPEEVFKYKLALSKDSAIFSSYILKNKFSIDSKYVHLRVDGCGEYNFTTYKNDDNWWVWFEPIWPPFKGMKKFSSIEKIIQFAVQQVINSKKYKGKSNGEYNYSILDKFPYRKRMKISDFRKEVENNMKSGKVNVVAPKKEMPQIKQKPPEQTDDTIEQNNKPVEQLPPPDTQV